VAPSAAKRISCNSYRRASRKSSIPARSNANPITATAGVATMEQLSPKVIDYINKLGESFAEGVRAVFKKANVKGQVTGIGSLQNVHFSDKLVMNGLTARESNKDILHLYYCRCWRKAFSRRRAAST